MRPGHSEGSNTPPPPGHQRALLWFGGSSAETTIRCGDGAAARAFGRVAASLRRSDRKTSARAYDAMIAAITAIAVANGLPVFTGDPVDCEGIENLEVVAVPIPG